MVRRPLRPEDLYDPANDPEIQAAYEDAIKNSENQVRWLARTKKNELRKERLEYNVRKFFEGYFENQSLSELLDFLDRDIDDKEYRNSCWLLSEAIAYNQLNQNYDEKKFDKAIGKIRDLMSGEDSIDSRLSKKTNISRAKREIKKIYSKSPINRDGTTDTLDAITSGNYFISEFLEISEDIFNEDTHRKKLNEMKSQLHHGKALKLVLSPILFLFDRMGKLNPELYHTLNLAQEYEHLDTIEGKRVANCFYVRSIELIRSYSGLYTERTKEDCDSKLDGLMELLRDSRENMSL